MHPVKRRDHTLLAGGIGVLFPSLGMELLLDTSASLGSRNACLMNKCWNYKMISIVNKTTPDNRTHSFASHSIAFLRSNLHVLSFA